MEWLKKVAEHHDYWLKVVNSFGYTSCAEDLVQEMYLRLYKYGTMELKENGEVDKTYIWVVLKNIHTDYHKQRKKIEKISIGDGFEIEDDIIEFGFEEANEELTYKMNSEIKSWHHYDQMLFRIYIGNDWSMQELAEKTKISKSSIFNTIKNCKKRLFDAIGEDYQDLMNGDYDKI